MALTASTWDNWHMRPFMLVTLAATAALSAVASAQAAPPSNDAFASAPPVTRAFKGRLAEATREPGEPGTGPSIWFSFRPSAPGRYAVQRIETYAEGLDVLTVSVFRGERVDELERVDSPDRRAPWYRTTFEAVASTTYRIRVAPRFGDDEMEDRWEVVPAPLPANDDFADAEPLRVPGRYEGSLVDATAEPGEPRHSGDRPKRSLWYRLRPAQTGRLTIRAWGRLGYEPSVSVYVGSRLRSLRPSAGVGGLDGAAWRFTALRGQTYWLAVDDFVWSTDRFTLTISDGSIEDKGVTLAAGLGQTLAGVIARGLRIAVTTVGRTSVRIELVVSRATARSLGLADSILGRTAAVLGHRDEKRLTIRLDADARAALEGRDSLRARLRLTLLHSDAPNRVLVVPLALPN